MGKCIEKEEIANDGRGATEERGVERREEPESEARLKIARSTV